jgi:hypothetical protein
MPAASFGLQTERSAGAGGLMSIGPVGSNVTVFVIVTVTYAPALSCWSSYTAENWKLVPIGSVRGETVPFLRCVEGVGGLTTQGAATTGRAVPATVSETASSSAASVATVARITFVQNSPQRGGANLDRLGRAVGDLTVPVGPDPFGRARGSRRHHQGRATTLAAGA